MHLILPSSSHASCELLLCQGNPEYRSARRGFTYKWMVRREQRQREVVGETYCKILLHSESEHNGLWGLCCHISKWMCWELVDSSKKGMLERVTTLSKGLLDIQAGSYSLRGQSMFTQTHTHTHIMGGAPFYHTFKHKDILKQVFMCKTEFEAWILFVWCHKISLCHWNV